MRQPLAVCLTVMLSMAQAVAEPSQYLCVPQQSGGINYDKQTSTWHATALTSENYVFRRFDKSELQRWWSLIPVAHGSTMNEQRAIAGLPSMGESGDIVSGSGLKVKAYWGFFSGEAASEHLLQVCVESKDDAIMGDRIFCQSKVPAVYFDLDSRRFELSFIGGYTGQAQFEQMRREYPESYKSVLEEYRKRGADITQPDLLMVVAGMCSPS
jgi:hypothetical protein